MVIGNLVQNAKTAQAIIAGAVERLPYARTCECASALKYALITRLEVVPAETATALEPLVGKYLNRS
jgi:5'-methylthioadenosine phosphorylase